MTEFKIATAADAKLIEALAAPIWREHYTPIIGSEQVEYMLNKFQNEKAVKDQIAAGYLYTIVIVDKEHAGYIAVEIRDNKLFLSKFYLHADYRGKGIARDMLDFVDQSAKDNNCHQIELTVNKYNPAYEIYLKLGFENVESIVMDIGNGYVMDDYRMIKNIH
ncbi:GNAT family N-acetyltransferase [Aliikangiella marina]|uniref:GNAT family N-acetyltransferase n=1 Tax=Aliikangiella marina TaxID=1712262 RepID=A0A545TE24_9GAMM|nr:GNAT family N-acetyltransferase [Aliikangiella marina]TQV75416.1 GNAT family N-acetyltransferase [Aliikangiella marina]